MASKNAPRAYFDVRKVIIPETGEQVGALVPVGGVDRQILRDAGYRIGQRVRSTVTKERSYGQHKYAHKLGCLVSANIDKFSGFTAHQVVKRLQVEADAGCDTNEIEIPGVGPVSVRVPRSISFDEMGEGDFIAMIRKICHHLAEKYFPTMDAEAVAAMIEKMPEET